MVEINIDKSAREEKKLKVSLVDGRFSLDYGFCHNEDVFDTFLELRDSISEGNDCDFLWCGYPIATLKFSDDKVCICSEEWKCGDLGASHCAEDKAQEVHSKIERLLKTIAAI